VEAEAGELVPREREQSERVDLDGVGALGRRHLERAPDGGQGVVANRRVGGEPRAFASRPDEADRLPQLVGSLEQVPLVEPAVEVAEVDGVVGREVGLAEVAEVRDGRAQLDHADRARRSRSLSE